MVEPWLVAVLSGLAGITGWVAHGFSVGATAERRVETRRRTHRPPVSHVRLRRCPYDQERGQR